MRSRPADGFARLKHLVANQLIQHPIIILISRSRKDGEIGSEIREPAR